MLTESETERFMSDAAAQIALRSSQVPAGIESGDLLSEAWTMTLRLGDFDPLRSSWARYVDRIVNWTILGARQKALSRSAELRLGGQFGRLDRASERVWAAMNAPVDDVERRFLVKNVELTAMEVSVLRAFLSCATAREVAERLCVKTSAVTFHLKSVYRRLGVDRLHLALVWAIRSGLVSAEELRDGNRL